MFKRKLNSSASRYKKNPERKILRSSAAAVVICLAVAGIALIVALGPLERSSESTDDSAQNRRARETLVLIAQAVARFGNEQHKLPTRVEELVPQYMPEVPRDPYGRHFEVIPNSSDKVFVRYFGKDGRAKGYVARDIDIVATVKKIGDKFEFVG